MRRGQPDQTDEQAVRRRRDDDGPAVVVDPRGPAREQGGQQGTDGLGGVEEAEQLGVVEDVGRQRGEQHHRERQHHADDVDDVGAEQVLAPDRVGPALADGPEAGRRGLDLVGVGAHRDVERGRHGEPGHVDDEAPADADVGDEQAADRRSDQDAELHPEAGQRVGGGDLVVADGARHQGLAAGPLQGAGRGQQPGDPEDDRDAGLVAERVDGEHRGEHGLADARPDRAGGGGPRGRRARRRTGRTPPAAPARPGRSRRRRSWSPSGRRSGTGSRRRRPSRRGRRPSPPGTAAGSPARSAAG